MNGKPYPSLPLLIESNPPDKERHGACDGRPVRLAWPKRRLLRKRKETPCLRASLFPLNPHRVFGLRVPSFGALASGLIALAATAPATAAPLCKPALAFRQVSFSPIDLETMRRRWTATLSVDASRCATTSGRFEILFVLWSETAPDDELIRAFDVDAGLDGRGRRRHRQRGDRRILAPEHRDLPVPRVRSQRWI